MRNRFIYFITLLAILGVLASFTHKEETPDFETLTFSRFYNFLDNFRGEKVYLHTDKPYYSAGENIWFKGYLVNAATLKPESLSGFIYVELINRDDSLFSRVKIPKTTTGFVGHIKLDQSIPTGDYNLRAYSQWMQNNSEDFFFSKNIHIGNRIEERVNLQTTYGEVTDGEVSLEIIFRDENTNPILGKEIEISGRWPDAKRSRRKKLSLTTNSIGKISFNLPVDTAISTLNVLDVVVNLDNHKHETQIFIPELSDDFDVQFFPESGVLLNKTGLQPVAFKAIGTDGMSRRVSGKLYAKNGEELSDINTEFNGMGKILLYTVPNESYFAILKAENGVEKRFELPQLEDEGVTLHLNYRQDKIFYSITNQLFNKYTPLYLLIHKNGEPLLVSSINKEMGQISGLDSKDGIFAFSVIDTVGNVYCERLFFINTPSPIKVSMDSDKEVYGKRELVNLSLKVQPNTEEPLEGFYSISVTDSRVVKPDTLNDNIISHLLLSSDLKGHIENPASYFINDSITSHDKLDLLMLTQGWSRFKTSDVLTDNLEFGGHYMEVSQTLSGKVTNIFGRPVKECDVIGLVSGSLIFTKTDSLGQYVFDGIGFQDSLTFLLKAQREKTILDVSIKPDLQIFPEPKSSFLTNNIKQLTPPTEYLDQSRQKFFNDGGMTHIFLDEFTVEAKKKSANAITENYLGLMANVIDSEQMDRMRNMDLLSILRTIPGVMVNGSQVTIRNNPGPPILLIDGVRRGDISDAEFMVTDDIENIQVLKGATASFFGPGSGNGVISINTKRGMINAPKIPPSMATVTPLGLQKPEEFYVPKYDVQSVRDGVNPDLRTTIYWNPELTNDASGMVNVSFYSADPANDYSVVLEGITQAGEICRYEGVIKRN